MIDYKSFYKGFQINFFDYKQLYLKYLLENHSNLGFEDMVLDYSPVDLKLSIKIDIRQTFFQSIETLFELVLALSKDKDGKINDRLILERITSSREIHKKIDTIADSKSELDFLDELIPLIDGRKEKLIKYIFYFGVNEEEHGKERINKSLESIKTALFYLANEFSLRQEYNCYKHGLRAIPALKGLALLDSKTKRKLYEADISDSITYYVRKNKENELQYITHVFDPDRDIDLTHACSHLMWNIVKLRNHAFNNKGKENKAQFLIFAEGFIDKALKQNVSIQTVNFTSSRKKN